MVLLGILLASAETADHGRLLFATGKFDALHGCPPITLSHTTETPMVPPSPARRTNNARVGAQTLMRGAISQGSLLELGSEGLRRSSRCVQRETRTRCAPAQAKDAQLCLQPRQSGSPLRNLGAGTEDGALAPHCL